MQKIGRVIKSNGTEGDVLVRFSDLLPEEVKEPVYIYFDGLPVPFFIESAQERGSKAILHLTGIHSLEDAEEIVGRDIYALDEDYEYEDEDELDVIGWRMEDEDGSFVGVIEDIEDIPGNICLCVNNGGNMVLVPFHEDLLVSIDPDSKTIVMNIPKGLLSE